MRFLAIILALGLTCAVGAPVLAGETGAPGVTIWRGKPGDHTAKDSVTDLPSWIRAWRDRVTVNGADPIPKEIHKRFRHAFPAGLFDWAHYRISGDDRLWRQAARRGYGSALVLVLDDVIVFRTADATRNHTLWYDGLAQAQDFRRRGPDRVVADRVAADRSATIVREIGPRVYPYPFLYPRWNRQRPPATGQGADDPGRIAVPGKIIVKPVNPFQND